MHLYAVENKIHLQNIITQLFQKTKIKICKNYLKIFTFHHDLYKFI